ncbi:MAG: hypothetical protein HC836_10750 [Richelia sp. RM2_1_2]|nr:hypothetical protein [Richelia sp. RM2_1_2]
MARVRYAKSSPYSVTDQTSWYLDFYRDPNVPFFGDDELVVIEPKFEYRPDLFSYTRYGTSNFWWVFQRRNMNLIRDPIWDFKANLTIYVPSRETMLNFGV